MKAGTGGKEAEEIPAPPAEETNDIDYDALYSRLFPQPATYIRVSHTVEELTGCQYNMVSEDDVWLQAFNRGRNAREGLSEDNFERIMESLEKTAEEATPYAGLDSTILPYETLSKELKKRTNDPELLNVAADVYEHWKARRETSSGHSIQPSLKFETHQENDDADPYVCFRRREARQTRKTRARDTQSTDKIKQLRKQLEEARTLIKLVHQREVQKRLLLKTDSELFEQRCTVRDAKRRLGIKDHSDEDFITQKVRPPTAVVQTIANSDQPQKRKSEFSQIQRVPPGSALRHLGRSDGRPMDADLELLSDRLEQKEKLLQKEIDDKIQQHGKWNLGHVDLTQEPLSPVNGQGPETGFRPATAQYQYLMTPPSSVTSESFDLPSPAQEKPEPLTYRYSSPPEEENRGQPAYRRRFGRGGRLWIDRRGMSSACKTIENVSSDRWKYDQDDEEEQPVYEMDPYNTKALRFRATIPFPPHYFQHGRQDSRARPGPPPANSRAIAPVQHPANPP